jgi:predicted ABC-type sugar transport system permease subunit
MSEHANARDFGTVVTKAISVWGLLMLLAILIALFSILKPDTFLTYFNIRSILSNKSVQALVALSVFIPMTANQFDLSAGFNVGISQVFAIGLQGQGLPWWAAVAAVILMGALVGLVNGVRPAGPCLTPAGIPGDFGQYLDRAGAGGLCPDREPRALARIRVSTAGALSLCPGRQPAGG